MKLAIHYTKENKAKEAIPEETYLISISRQFVVVGVCQNMILHLLLSLWDLRKEVLVYRFFVEQSECRREKNEKCIEFNTTYLDFLLIL